jgi:Ca2+-transporting ATPase
MRRLQPRGAGKRFEGSPDRAVCPVHASVKGRVRLKVVGLYRSPDIKLRLEAGLSEMPGIRSVDANPLTGRVLILFASGVSLADLMVQIEGLVEANRSRRQGRRVTRRDPLSLKMFRALESVLLLFRSLTATPAGHPVFGALAGGTAAAVEKQGQDIADWHLFGMDELAGRLGVDAERGLSSEEAGQRLARYGENSLAGSERRSDLAIFLGQFASAPVALLGASAAISVATGGAADALVILGVVMINGVIGFVTERQAEKTINSLAESGVKSVAVLRDGENRQVPVEHLVPGDVLLLTPGTYIAADVRLLRSHRLTVDESALTGESLPVSKEHEFAPSQETALADRKNMAFMGTHVTGGNGRGLVVATAEATELGQIQTMVGEAESPDTPMQRQLDKMGTQLAVLSSVVCAGVFVVGILRGYGWLEMLKSSVSLAVAAVPEGLPAVATTTLAMGIADMRKRNVAVRHLDAVESLGSVQVFCMDKTGTLTMNKMSVVSVFSGGREFDISQQRFVHEGVTAEPQKQLELVRLMQVVSLCSETEIVGSPTDYRLEGSATENALVELALNSGIDVNDLRRRHAKLKTRYRAEGRPYMSTLHPFDGGKHLLAVKGNPDALLALCTFQMKDGRRVRLNQQARDRIIAHNEVMAGNALRVLGVAFRELDEGKMPDKTSGLTWVGMAGMADPMRPDMDKLIAEYHKAGIHTIMITGDQSATAQAIGRQLGLSGDKPLQVLESSALDEMDPELLAGLAKNVHVFARVSPAHKLKIVRAMQEAGYVVAMTGDGINDGPALKAADIGVAMGEGGTNVARDVSDVVLEDDNLHTMAVAVRQGRTIYNNIRKMIHFMVSTNLTEIEVMLAGIAVGWGQPMNPMQLLWINLVTDIFPGLALALEPAEPDIMRRSPRDPDEAIIEGDDLKRMVFESATIGVGTMGAFYYGMRRYGDIAAASTMAFNTLTMNELVHAYSSRSSERNVLGGKKLPPNKHLKHAILGMTALQVVVSVVPSARRLLGTTPLGLMDLVAIGAGVALPLIVNESTKPGPGTEGEDDDSVLEGEVVSKENAE